MKSEREIKSVRKSRNTKTFEFEGFSFDTEQKILFRGEEKISMPPKTCELLAVLLENRGRLMSKDELFAEVWADTFVEEANLSHHIAVLRKALGENGERKFIETVPRRGYRFVAPTVESFGGEVTEIVGREKTSTRIVKEIEIVSDEDEINIESEKSLALSQQTNPSKYGLFSVVLIAAFTALVVGFIFYQSNSRQNDEKKKIAAALPIVTRVNDKNISISVISPDGKFIAAAQNSNVKNGGSLSIRQLDTNREIQLLAPDESRIFADMKFSFDGSLIYFIAYEKGEKNGAIYRIPFLGGVKQKIADLGEGNHSFAIAPDGKQVAFYRNAPDGESCSLIALPIDNPSEKEKVLFTFKFDEDNFGNFLSWSPDGKFIGMAKYPSPSLAGVRIFGFDLETNELKQFSEEVFENIGKHVFSPDGREILFIGKRANSPQNFFAVNIFDGSLRSLSVETPDATFYSNYGLSITADGKTISADLTDTRADIWSAESNGGTVIKEAQRIKRGTSDGKRGLAVLPDGKILYTAVSNGKSDIWKMNADGANAQPLTNDSFLERNLTASKDGRFVVFSSNVAGGWHLFRMNTADGGDIKQLTFGDSLNIQPDISRDGNWIVYISEENGKSIIKKIPFDGGEPVILNDKENSVYPKFSPDGTKIAFQILSPSRSQTGAIAIISKDNGGTEKTYAVTEFQHRNEAAPIQWSPDGSGIFFLKLDTAVPNLWRLDLQSGTAEKIWTSFPDETVYNFAFSADGSRLYLSRGVYQANTVLIRNFNGGETR